MPGALSSFTGATSDALSGLESSFLIPFPCRPTQDHALLVSLLGVVAETPASLRGFFDASQADRVLARVVGKSLLRILVARFCQEVV